MFKLRTLALFLTSISTLLTIQGQAAVVSQPFIHYFDCLRSTKNPLVDVDVFMKVQGEPSKKTRPASSYTRGVDIDLVLNEKHEILGLQMQPDKNYIPVTQLKAGLQFGILNKTFHTIELAKDFDPQKGGKLVMGTLASISARTAFHMATEGFGNHLEPDADLRKAHAKHPELGLSEKLGRHYNSDEKPSKATWKQETFEIKKHNGAWVLTNSQGKPVDVIFVDMKTPSASIPFVIGLEKIQSVQANSAFHCSALKPEQLAAKSESDSNVSLDIKAATKSTLPECNRN